jgi:transcriptional regulator with XRE-family HTH domain
MIIFVATIDQLVCGVVTCSYVTNLRKGRIENPGYEKMLAIAKAMNFPPEAWFEEMPASGARPSLRRAGTSPGGSVTSSRP